jgi:hypothetical protein
MNEDDSFRMLDDTGVFYVCVLLFMFALVFGGCSPAPELTAPTVSERMRLGYPCETWVRQTGGDAKPVFACVKAVRE